MNQSKKAVNKRRKLRKGRVAMALALVVAIPVILFSLLSGNDQTASAEIEVKHVDADVKDIAVVTEEEKKAAVMDADRFARVVGNISDSLGVKNVNPETFEMIFDASTGKDVPPFLLAGIAWKESNFRADATGVILPRHGNDRARGMFQIIGATARNLGVDPEAVYDPYVGAEAASKLLSEQANWFAGIEGEMSMPDRFKNFEADGDFSRYKGKLVTDHNGQPMSRLLLATIAYNAGPGHVVNSLDKYGLIYMTPNTSNWSLPHQTLEYVLLIDKYFYDFEISFSYSREDLDRKKISNNQ